MAYLWIIPKKNTVYCSPSIFSTLLCGDMNLCEGVSLITNPQRTKLCWLWSFLATGAANSFYMLQPAWSRTGSFSKGLRSARRRGEELCKAHTQRLGGISVAEVVWLFSHTPCFYSTKRQHARLPFFPVLPTFIFIIIFLYVYSSSFHQHHAGLVNAIFFFSLNTKGAACSAECTLVPVVGNRANATPPGTAWLGPSSDRDAPGGVWACLQPLGQASLMLFISGHRGCSEHDASLLTGPTSSLRGAYTH